MGAPSGGKPPASRPHRCRPSATILTTSRGAAGNPRSTSYCPEGTDLGVIVFEYDEAGAIAIIEGTSLEIEPGPHRRVEVLACKAAPFSSPSNHRTSSSAWPKPNRLTPPAGSTSTLRGGRAISAISKKSSASSAANASRWSHPHTISSSKRC